MPKITLARFKEIVATPEVQEIFKITVSLKTLKEVEIFFKDLFTEVELHRLINRWLAAKWLRKASPYRQIVQKTGISLTTLLRVNEGMNNYPDEWKFLFQRAEDKTDNPYQELLKLIVSLKTPKGLDLFFTNLVSRLEMYKLRKRWMAVKMLDQNIPYRQISREVNLSLSTVLSIAQRLHQGGGGWKLALRKIQKKKL